MSQRLRCAFAVVVCLLFASVASAQQSLKDGEFTVQRFAPAPGPRNFVTVEGARTDGQMAFSIGIVGNYGNDPFVINIKPCTPSVSCARTDLHIVETVISADLLASLTVVPRLQLGLRLPYTFVKGAGLTTDPNDTAFGQQLRGGLEGSGLGDPMLEAKLRAFGSPGDPSVIGVALFGTAPVADSASGTKDKLIGDSSATFGVRGIYDGQWGRFGAALNVAGVYRNEALIGPTHLGSELRYGLGASYELSPVLNVLAEGFGSTKFSSEAGTNALEALIAGQFRPLGSRLVILAGGGVGVIQAVGV